MIRNATRVLRLGPNRDQCRAPVNTALSSRFLLKRGVTDLDKLIKHKNIVI